MKLSTLLGSLVLTALQASATSVNLAANILYCCVTMWVLFVVRARACVCVCVACHCSFIVYWRSARQVLLRMITPASSSREVWLLCILLTMVAGFLSGDRTPRAVMGGVLKSCQGAVLGPTPFRFRSRLRELVLINKEEHVRMNFAWHPWPKKENGKERTRKGERRERE